jgi:hypothetical protein
MQVDTNVGRICARLGWLPLDAEKALEVGLGFRWEYHSKQSFGICLAPPLILQMETE